MRLALPSFAKRLAGDKSGLALLEFALILPAIMTMGLTGAELTNYITTRMRVSQIALQLADNAARMGSGPGTAMKKVTEADINDLFTGAELQSGEMDLLANGRVILSDLEPMASPNTTGLYKIGWQRCFGLKTYPSNNYGVAGQTNVTGMGPAGRQASAQDDNATMFVEVYYVYQPLIGLGSLGPSLTMIDIASMAVRDRRDLSDDSATTNLHPNGVYKVTGVTASTC